MDASADFIYLFISGLAWDADETNTTFYDTLKAASRARLTDSAKGKVLVGTSAGGASVTYALPPLGDLTGKNIADLCGCLLRKVDALIAADPAVSDTEIVAALLEQFKPVKRVRADFSALRL